MPEVAEVEVLALMPPPDDRFAGDFDKSEALTELAWEIVERHVGLSFVKGYSLEVLWKREGGKKAGRLTLGKCTSPSGLASFYSEMDWVIWIAADHARSMGLTAQQLEALLYHELLHCTLSDGDEPAPATIGHDIEAFLLEIEEYGFWKRDLEEAAKVFAGRQLRLLEPEEPAGL